MHSHIYVYDLLSYVLYNRKKVEVITHDLYSTISLHHLIVPLLGPGATGTSDSQFYYDIAIQWFLLSSPYTSTKFPNFMNRIGLGVMAISSTGSLTWIGESIETSRQQRPALFVIRYLIHG